MKDKKTRLVENAKKEKIKEAAVESNTRSKLGFLIIGIALFLMICFGFIFL